MNALELIRRLHQHRAWVNQKLLAAAETLDAAQLQEKLPIGQGSIWRSLMHLYGAEYAWLAAVQGEEAAVLPGDVADQLPGNQAGEGGIRTLGELKERWSQQESRWRDYLAGALAEEQLDELVYRKSSYGPRRATRRVDALLHVCTHAHYTTAQVINMLRQVGVKDLPDPMLISLARQEVLDGAG